MWIFAAGMTSHLSVFSGFNLWFILPLSPSQRLQPTPIQESVPPVPLKASWEERLARWNSSAVYCQRRRMPLYCQYNLAVALATLHRKTSKNCVHTMYTVLAQVQEHSSMHKCRLLALQRDMNNLGKIPVLWVFETYNKSPFQFCKDVNCRLL